MLWVVISSFLAALVLAFGLGANDVSNAFATSIGSKVITLRTACLIASIAEMAGSLGLGGLVTESVITTTIIPNVMAPEQMMLVMLSALIAVSLWLLIATWLKLPVSATHAVISSIIGGTLVANYDAVNWRDMNRFFIAWVVAPVLSGLLSVCVYLILAKFILYKADSFRRGIISIPFIYVLTILVNLILILSQVLKRTCMDTSSCALYIGIASFVVLLVGIITYLIARYAIVPYVKKKIQLKTLQSTQQEPAVTVTNFDDTKQSDTPLENNNEAGPQTEQLFAFLQILSAIFTSFVHGSNDVSNSVGPLYGLYNAYQTSTGSPLIDSTSLITYGLLAYGGMGMIFGLYIWGSRVIETIGENLAPINPSRGFSIEFGSALTVLLASVMRLSLSTTHCKVGSIVSVGFVSAHINAYIERKKKETELAVEDGQTIEMQKARNMMTVTSVTSLEAELVTALRKVPVTSTVNPGLIFSIIASWVVTIPFAGFLAAGIYAGLAYLAL